MRSAHDRQTECSLLLLHDSLRRAGGCARSSRLVLLLDATELFGIGEDDVHVFVKGQHLPGHLAAIVQSDSHPVVDVAGHLALLVGRHLCDKMLQSSFFWFSKIGNLQPKSGV